MASAPFRRIPTTSRANTDRPPPTCTTASPLAAPSICGGRCASARSWWRKPARRSISRPAATYTAPRCSMDGRASRPIPACTARFVAAHAAAAFDLAAGSDLYGTTLFNGRPGIAADPSKPGLIQTAYGLLDPNPTPGERLLARNYGRGPGQFNVNLRIAKTIGFGKERGGSGDPRPAASAGQGAALAAVGGRGLGGLIGSPSTSHRFNLSIGLSVRNLLNHTNPGPIVGNITSPYFGFANQIAGGQNGEGFYETANNRRLESQIKFTF